MGANVRGVAELRAVLAELRGLAALNEISYRGTFGAAKELRAEIHARVLSNRLIDSGALIRNIAQKRIKRGTKFGYTVGIRHGEPRQVRRSKEGAPDDPFYWWFLEFGTVRIQPRPFMRQAWAAYQARAGNVVQAQALAAVIKSAERVAKKHRGKSMSSRKGG